ncbi:unnamed protein product [Fraxinus pennsylvanica]|uniref:Uncharacterized protein n=1 Tax=Fraxinus pennsylvanica TaxID=56036 RepID=A0AAD1ZIL0_9LAMI|nr:unnamed protein product [Fraxinus pennsylvanica]
MEHSPPKHIDTSLKGIVTKAQKLRRFIEGDEGVYLLMALRHASQALGPTQIYASLASKKTIAVEKLKAGQVYLSTCPFKKISIFFANKMIGEAASKATTLGVDWQNTVNGLVYL